ncbi:MAG: WG repeat-containing protein [Flammeovirgaceae bacterium]
MAEHNRPIAIFASMKWLFCWVLLFFVPTAEAEVYQLFEENGKKGIKNEQGQVVIPASFEALGWSDGSFSVIGNVTGYRAQQQWGIINLQKQFVTPADFETLVYGGGDNIVARKRISPIATKTGVLNLQGQVKIPFAYDGIQINGLRAIVFNLTNVKFWFGLADLENKLLLPLAYKNIFSLGTLRFAVQQQEGKMALYSEEGRPVTDFTIDSVSAFYKGFAIIYQNSLQGLINREGIIKLKPIYQSIKIDSEGLVFAQLPNEWRWLNAKNETVKTFQADDLITLNEGLQLVTRANQIGVVDSNLQSVIPIAYETIVQVGDFFIARKGKKFGLIDRQNKTRIDFKYDSMKKSGKNLLAFTTALGWQLINLNGQVTTDKYYQSLEPKQEYYVARHRGFAGLVDASGKEVLRCVFDSILQINNTMAAVKFKEQYGIMDFHENWKIAPQAFPVVLVNDTHYLQRQPANSFLKTFDGQIIYFTPYPTAFEKDYWLERLPDGGERRLSYDGTLLRAPAPPAVEVERVTNIFRESEGMRGVQKDGKFGFIDTKGKLRIANRYDSIQDFHEGLAPIKLIGKWGFINMRDEIVVHPNYHWVAGFDQGICLAQQNGKYGAIDPRGQTILNFRYDALQMLPNGKLALQMDNKKGRANAKGQIQIEARFDHLEETEDGNLIAGQSGSYGVISADGLNLIPMMYQQLSYDREAKVYIALLKSEMKPVSVN